MTDTLGFEKNDQLIAAARQAGADVRVIGTTLAGREIICAKVGGNKQPAVLVTSGAHAPEISGVCAAMTLLRDLKTDRALYIVPNRDPLGLEGFGACLSLAFGRHVEWRGYDELIQIVREGSHVVYERDDLLVALAGELSIAILRPGEEPWAGNCYYTMRALSLAIQKHPDLMKALRGRRVILPANLPRSEGVGLFERALSAYVTQEGILTHWNRMFDHPERPVEVACVRTLVDEIRPGLSLDLHEGFGGKFYLFVHSFEEVRLQQISRAATRAIMEHGYTLSDLEELAPLFMTPQELAMTRYVGDGIFVTSLALPGQGQSFQEYASRCGLALTTETGLHNDLSTRTKFQVWSAWAALEWFETQSQA